ncbi:MAG: glutaredoxin family protein [Acidimicrobiia bacterium]|nr:glutaredoxin family protein [Acidimicrobiia bacterium]
MRYRRVMFLTRPGCGLCDEALPVVKRATRRLGVELVTVDITADSNLEAEFDLRIPVILDRKGRVLAEGRISRGEAWRAALSAFF